jgi:hypothetical protein
MRIGKIVALGALAIGVSVVVAPRANAAFIATMEQVGSDVVITGSGSFDTSDLTSISPDTSSGSAFVVPSQNIFFLGGGGTNNSFTGLTSDHSTFGAGSPTNTSDASGAVLGIAFADGLVPNSLYLPDGYVSGTSVSDLTTFDSTTLAALGVTPGTYTWTWGTGPDADSFTLNIGAPDPTPTPEPASLVLLGTGLAALGLNRLRRRKGA